MAISPITTSTSSAPSTAPVTPALNTIQQAYNDNADYAEVGGAAGVVKCKLFMSAARRLLLKLPMESGTRESHMRMNPDLIAAEIQRAQQWLEANDVATSTSSSSSSASGPRVTRGDFRNFRC